MKDLVSIDSVRDIRFELEAEKVLLIQEGESLLKGGFRGDEYKNADNDVKMYYTTIHKCIENIDSKLELLDILCGVAHNPFSKSKFTSSRLVEIRQKYNESL